MRELAIHKPCMVESARLFGNPVQVLPYPSPVKQSYRAGYARAHNSRALHCGKGWRLSVSSAGISLSATRIATLPSALCASSQFASPAWLNVLADWCIQCRYTPIRHPQSNPTQRLMFELSFREPYLGESAGRFGYPVQMLPY
jgi:hypothetical protein